ncbi:MAG: hypothetical protein HYZ45_04440, partial [Burkholderiales bacterium]|nr:hypothetical protein [Burkholderiales bacterium]
MPYFAALSLPLPQPLLKQRLLRLLLAYLLLACGLFQLDARAAEVGNIRVLSHIGQPLRAEIELAAVAPDEAANLQVKLALPDVYRLANIRRNPVLNNVRLQLQQQAGRYLVMVQSNQTMLESYLNMYLEFSDGKGHEVRAVTLWLEADPDHPSVEAANPSKEITHPDGDLSETAAIPPSPFAVKVADSEKPLPLEHKAVPTAISEAELAGHAAPPRHLPKNAPRLAPQLATESIMHTSCGANVRKLQQEANRCKLIEGENAKIAGKIDALEDKVGILKRVILAEDAPVARPVVVTEAATAPPPKPISAKKKSFFDTFPWKILARQRNDFCHFVAVRHNFFSNRVAEHWNKLNDDVVKAPSLT